MNQNQKKLKQSMFLIGGIQEDKKINEKQLNNLRTRKLDKFRINVKKISKKEI